MTASRCLSPSCQLLQQSGVISAAFEGRRLMSTIGRWLSLGTPTHRQLSTFVELSCGYNCRPRYIWFTVLCRSPQSRTYPNRKICCNNSPPAVLVTGSKNKPRWTSTIISVCLLSLPSNHHHPAT